MSAVYAEFVCFLLSALEEVELTRWIPEPDDTKRV